MAGKIYIMEIVYLLFVMHVMCAVSCCVTRVFGMCTTTVVVIGGGPSDVLVLR